MSSGGGGNGGLLYPPATTTMRAGGFAPLGMTNLIIPTPPHTIKTNTESTITNNNAASKFVSGGGEEEDHIHPSPVYGEVQQMSLVLMMETMMMIVIV